MKKIHRTQLTHRPFALVGILDPVNQYTPVIDQLDILAAVAQPSHPAADNIANRIIGRKLAHVRRYNKVLPNPNRYIRENKVHTLNKSPAVQIDRLGAVVIKLNVLLIHVLRLV